MSKLTGWAVESRVYAEDPTRGFLPSTGRLVKYRPPRGTREASRSATTPASMRAAKSRSGTIDDRQARHPRRRSRRRDRGAGAGAGRLRDRRHPATSVPVGADAARALAGGAALDRLQRRNSRTAAAGRRGRVRARLAAVAAHVDQARTSASGRFPGSCARPAPCSSS